jgi:hypothetical protein
MTSGLSCCTAVDVTTASAPITLAAAWPTKVWMPSSDRRRSVTLSAMSEPEIR